MESQLQSLIDKIRSDGVAEAERQGKAVIDEAEQKASQLVADAEKKAEGIIARAKQDAERTEDAGKKAIEQAGRNLVLGLEGNIKELFDRVLKEEISEAMTPEVLASVLESVIAKWSPESGVVVELSEKDSEKLTTGLLAKVQQKAKGGVTLKPVETVDAGFSISEKNGSLFYDFTSGGITEILAEYLNPMLGEILKKGAK
jgi:V/A-type H+-transporting ATPase subunit E